MDHVGPSRSVMQMCQPRLASICCAAAAFLGVAMPVAIAWAEERPPPPAFPTSPFHRAQDGNQQTIPCRCSYRGQLVPVGTSVCMQTHVGRQIARCDLNINVTTWVPTGVSCEMSWQRNVVGAGNG
jgi:hypothetical protein